MSSTARLTAGTGGEPGRHREWSQRLVIRPIDRPVAAHTIDRSVQQHHLAIEVVEGSEAEVPVLANGANRDNSLVHAFYERSGRRHLI